MSSAPASPAHGLRRQVERASLPVMARLHAMPRLVTPAATLVLIVVGAFAPIPVALAAFALLFLFVAWIAYLSWPVVPASGRVMRLAMLVLIVVLAALRFRADARHGAQGLSVRLPNSGEGHTSTREALLSRLAPD